MVLNNYANPNVDVSFLIALMLAINYWDGISDYFL